jgi:hypothetical protein
LCELARHLREHLENLWEVDTVRRLDTMPHKIDKYRIAKKCDYEQASRLNNRAIATAETAKPGKHIPTLALALSTIIPLPSALALAAIWNWNYHGRTSAAALFTGGAASALYISAAYSAITASAVASTLTVRTPRACAVTTATIRRSGRVAEATANWKSRIDLAAATAADARSAFTIFVMIVRTTRTRIAAVRNVGTIELQHPKQERASFVSNAASALSRY